MLAIGVEAFGGCNLRSRLYTHSDKIVVEEHMNKNLSILLDPEDGQRLAQSEFMLVGSKRSYPIIKGIPRFVGTENYASDFGRQWKMFSKTQLDSYTKLPISRTRLERCLNRPLQSIAGKLILEAGSGAG